MGLAVISGLVDDVEVTAGDDGGVIRMSWPTTPAPVAALTPARRVRRPGSRARAAAVMGLHSACAPCRRSGFMCSRISCS